MAEFEDTKSLGDPSHYLRAKTVMAFLQARMGSHRLPGKVLMRIHGQSILERAIRRLRAAPVIDEVAVLTTCHKEDDAIVKECSRMGVLVYRGPDEDVLLRFHEASMTFNPEIIIRATADNPLIEIGSVDRIVAALRSNELDLCMEQELPYGAATEAITAKALEKVHSLALNPRHREHVTLYIWDNPDEFRVSQVLPPDSVRYPKIRVTIDTLEDFQYVEQLVGRVVEEETPLPLQEYLAKALDDRLLLRNES
jgi:spore coat polysaccharide biosynthesis protein SpsF